MITLRVKDPSQSARFYRDVLGFQVEIADQSLAHVVLPQGILRLVHDDRMDELHGPGSGRHRLGVGVEIHVSTPSPAEVAERIRTRGGFLVRESEDSVTARDGDGYVVTFERAV